MLYFTLVFGKNLLKLIIFFFGNKIMVYFFLRYFINMIFNFSLRTAWFLNVRNSIGKISEIKTALKYAIVVKSKHFIYSLLTHKLIAISVCIAVQTGTFSKCKIFSRERKINSSHSFKSLEVNQNQFIVPIKIFLWKTSI